ncbi:MAG: hypothetical protein ABJB66_02215 [Gemmatimonadaceae bacterium]
MSNPTPDWLLGTWRLSRADPALDFAPGVRMEFATDSELRYHVDVGGKDQILDLIYHVENDTLHTENLITSHTMSVTFVRESGDVLVLDFGGVFAWLLRE